MPNNVDQVLLALEEMSISAGHIRGEAFAQIVSALLALDGMLDLGTRLVGAAPEFAGYQQPLQLLHQNVEELLLNTLPQDVRQEARNLASQMMDRQRAMHANMGRMQS